MAYNLAGILKQIGPEVMGQFSGMAPEFAQLLQGQQIGNSDKGSAVYSAVQKLLAPPADAPRQSGLDRIQTAMDIAGVVDPTPVIDAANMAISLARAVQSTTKEERTHHIKNAVISAVSMVPYIGDLAKLSKLTGSTGKPPVSTSAAATVMAELVPHPRPAESPATAPVGHGMVRMYHGGHGPGTQPGPRFLTPDLNYAKGYAEKSGGTVQYVDVPETHPKLEKAFDDTGTNTTAPFKSFEAPEELAKLLQPFVEESSQQPGIDLPPVPPPQITEPLPPPQIREPVAPPVQAAAPGRVESMISNAAAGASSMVAPSQPAAPTAGIDKLQTGLDIAGVADPTPIIDGVNMGISLFRAAKAQTPEERSQHLQNAAISAISMVPLVGDTAKLAKIPGMIGKAEAKAGTRAAARQSAESASRAARREQALSRYPNVARPVSPSSTPQPSLPHPAKSVPTGPQASPSGAHPLTGTPVPSPTSSGSSAPVPPPAGPPQTTPPGPSKQIPPPGRTPPPVPPAPPTFPPAPGPVPMPGTPGGGGPGGNSPLFPLLAGGAAGALTAFLTSGPGVDFTRPKHHSLVGDLAGREKVQIFSELGSIVKNRGAEIFNPILNPINALMDPIGAATTSIKGMIKAVDEIPSAIMKWGESLKESQRHLMMWSGSLANAFLESQVRQQIRDFGSATRTSGSTTPLIEALDDLKDELQPTKDAITNAANMVATAAVTLTRGVWWLIENFQFYGISLKNLTDATNELVKKFGDPEAATAAYDFMENIRKLPDRHTRPPFVP